MKVAGRVRSWCGRMLRCIAGFRVCGEEGAELVEFSLVSMVIFFVTFSLMGLCVVLWEINSTAEASRDAARWASVRGADCSSTLTSGTCPVATLSDIQTFVTNDLLSYGTLTVSSVKWCDAAGDCSTTLPTAICGAAQCNNKGNSVQVTVSYTFAQAYFPFIHFPNAFTFSNSSTHVMW